jgi:hypothetical protein
VVATLRRGSEGLLGGADVQVLAGCFGNEHDHLLLYFRLVAWGLLAGLNNGGSPKIFFTLRRRSV